MSESEMYEAMQHDKEFFSSLAIGQIRLEIHYNSVLDGYDYSKHYRKYAAVVSFSMLPMTEGGRRYLSLQVDNIHHETAPDIL